MLSADLLPGAVALFRRALTLYVTLAPSVLRRIFLPLIHRESKAFAVHSKFILAFLSSQFWGPNLSLPHDLRKLGSFSDTLIIQDGP